jgi:hypothetical protein
VELTSGSQRHSNTWRQIFDKDNDANGGINGRNQTKEQYTVHLKNMAEYLNNQITNRSNGALSTNDLNADRELIHKLVELEAESRVLNRYQKDGTVP